LPHLGVELHFDVDSNGDGMSLEHCRVNTPITYGIHRSVIRSLPERTGHSDEKLTSTLRAKLGSQPEKAVSIEGDPKVPSNQVLDAIDAVSGIGAQALILP
jgi:biopolymer transport protein ExbD